MDLCFFLFFGFVFDRFCCKKRFFIMGLCGSSMDDKPTKRPLKKAEREAIFLEKLQHNLPLRYQVISIIAHGNFGTVVHLKDRHANGMSVALKDSAAFYEDDDNDEQKEKDQPRFQPLPPVAQSLIEVFVLTRFRHPNIIPIENILPPLNPTRCRSVRIVMPLVSHSLREAMRGNIFTITDERFKCILYQLLCAIKYSHARYVMHRDIKPENILIKESCELFLCDYGLASIFAYGIDGSTPPPKLTEYTTTRWYRAPEVLQNQPYGPAIDLWSVGCIAIEMLNPFKKNPPAFFAGNDSKHQLELIKSALSPPCKEWLNLMEECKKEDVDGADLLEGLLEINPSMRLTAMEAVDHPFFKSIRAYYPLASVVPITAKPFIRQDLPWYGANHPQSNNGWRAIYYDEVARFHPKWRLITDAWKRNILPAHATPTDTDEKVAQV